MIISSPIKQEKTYDCYDFTFVGGVVIPVTLDLAAGDSVELGHADRIYITIQERPSLNDPDKLLPAENLVLERRNMLGYTHRVQKVAEVSADQKAEWDKTIQDLTTKTIQ